MHIRLVNFRCYSDATFDLGNSTMALISGPSGMGKSSIFLGIYFALYGVGKKVAAHGKKSCRVELEMENMKIIRSRAPNRLVLKLDGESYDGDVAQEMINRKFGDTFEVTGYIAQNAVNSFIMMSPVEKLKFLEKFAFRDINLVEIKANSKTYISETCTALTSVTSQLEMARQVFSEMKIPEQVKFPIKCKPEQRELASKNEGIRLKNAITLIKRYRRDYTVLLKELEETRILNNSISIRKETEKTLIEQNKEINRKLSDIQYDPKILENLEKKLILVQARSEISKLEVTIKADTNRLKEMRQDELDQISTKISDIESTLYETYTKQEIVDTKADLESALVDMVSLEKISRELLELDTHNAQTLEYLRKTNSDNTILLREKQTLLDLAKLQDKIRSCPSCSAKLRIDGDNLVMCGESTQGIPVNRNELSKEISALASGITSLNKEISKIEASLEKISRLNRDRDIILEKYQEISSSENIRQQLREITEYEWEQNKLEKTMETLKQELIKPKFSQSYRKLEYSLTQNIKKLEELREVTTDTLIISETEQELQNLITSEKVLYSEYKTHTSRLSENSKSLKDIQKTINAVRDQHTSVYGTIRSEQEIQQNLDDVIHDISDQEHKRDISDKNIKIIEEYQRYQKDLKNYKEWKVKVLNLEKQEKIARNKYASATELRETILKAESIAVTKIIDNINTHAALFLDSFFPDHPIMVHLQPFKQSKKSADGKPQINIEIEYRGMECDIASLSGGELSRVILAYTLALTEMFNTPILLLDECTSSLDQELTGIVFDSIRENFPNKSVFIIAHQVITGTFDKVISLTKN